MLRGIFRYTLLQEGDLLVFEWRFLVDPEQSLCVTRSTTAQGMLPGHHGRGCEVSDTTTYEVDNGGCIIYIVE